MITTLVITALLVIPAGFLIVIGDQVDPLEEAKRISEDMNFAEVSKMMYGMTHTYIIFQDQVITPLDICMALQSDRIEFLG